MDIRDEARHFLHAKSESINNSLEKLLDTIVEEKDRRKFVKKVEASLYQLYSYRCWLYVFKVLGFILQQKKGITPDTETLYNEMYSVLSAMTRVTDVHNVIELQTCLDSFPDEYQRIISDVEETVDNLFTLFFKLSSQIILLDLGVKMRDNFTLTYSDDEIVPPKEYFVQYNSNEVDRMTFLDEESKRLYEFYFLYEKIKRGSSKYKAAAADYFYEEFFTFVNNVIIQDKYLSNNSKLAQNIENLYKIFYYEMKYPLYRGYDINAVDEPLGFMRHDLLDRKISRDFINLAFPEFKEENFDLSARLVFKHMTPRLVDEEFILRPANEQDIENILALNYPIPPYRRAIYVPSNESEIREAVSRHMVWLIEQRSNDNEIYCLACAAIILKYIYDPTGQTSNFDVFNSDSLNTEYAKEYYKNVKRPFCFVDFDSVLTYSGRDLNISGAAFSERSYRGYGFQRLMMVLCEELAVSVYNSDYIVGTVSSFNRFSRHNFALQGFKKQNDAMYGLDEGMDESPFSKFINGEDATAEQIKEWKLAVNKEIDENQDILDRLGITTEEYWDDEKVPRMFMLLPLK